MVVQNKLNPAGAAIGTDTNIITMITGEEEISLELMSKEEAAERIVDQILRMKKNSKMRQRMPGEEIR